MTLANVRFPPITISKSLLTRLIETPDLARTVRALPVESFAALVRAVGVADAGELVALATTEQIIQAFDEDLFIAARAGEREVFDAVRFATWLEVLLEAGDEAAAQRFAELDEDFVAHALSSIVLVFDEDALREHMGESNADDARQVDKALESALTEDLDGYLLVAKQPDGWDAALTLILALDCSHRALLERILDRLTAVTSGLLDDFDELATVLSEGESLAEDVEATREERRSRQGYVEPRAARAFLELARQPLGDEPWSRTTRDPLTRSYFRDLERSSPASTAVASHGSQPRLPLPLPSEHSLDIQAPLAAHPIETEGSSARADMTRRFFEALRKLGDTEPTLFEERMEELVYLANVVVAGIEVEGRRVRPQEAIEAVVATVSWGAQAAVCRGEGAGSSREVPPPSLAIITEALRRWPLDILFRRASGALAASSVPDLREATGRGIIFSARELAAALARLSERGTR